MRRWWGPLCTRPTRLVDFYSASSLIQQCTGRHLWHIILIGENIKYVEIDQYERVFPYLHDKTSNVMCLLKYFDLTSILSTITYSYREHSTEVGRPIFSCIYDDFLYLVFVWTCEIVPFIYSIIFYKRKQYKFITSKNRRHVWYPGIKVWYYHDQKI